ncbi:MAG: hypothetical protein FWC09_11290 [Lachnospiraceae bacterium]|nr:hypothetical protein [Lachnospiraceae bacterium]
MDYQIRKLFYLLMLISIVTFLSGCASDKETEDEKIYFIAEETASQIKMNHILSFTKQESCVILK